MPRGISSRPALFDPIDRWDASPKKHEESSIAFYERVPGVFWQAVRERMQDWADELPDSAYIDVRNRLRSRDDYEFNSTYLELYLHEMLRRAGYKITIHPELPNGRRIDFLAIRDDGSFYLEAIAPATNRGARAQAARRARVYDVIDRTDDDNWMLWIEEVQVGPASPPAARLRRDLRQWLESLHPNEYDIHHRPSFGWEHEGWVIAVSALPRTAGARGRSGRSIGVYPIVTGVVDNASDVTKALKRKRNEYGRLDLPLVVAIGVYHLDRDSWGVANALWGREIIQVSLHDPDRHGSLGRAPDGYFGLPGSWRHTDLSAVLVVDQLTPTHFSQASVSLWRHPGATRPLHADLGLPVVSWSLEGDNLVSRNPTVSASSFFALPDPWPPGEAFPRDDAAT